MLLPDAKAPIASMKARMYAIDVRLHITALGNAKSDTGKPTSRYVRGASSGCFVDHGFGAVVEATMHM